MSGFEPRKVGAGSLSRRPPTARYAAKVGNEVVELKQLRLGVSGWSFSNNRWAKWLGKYRNQARRFSNSELRDRRAFKRLIEGCGSITDGFGAPASTKPEPNPAHSPAIAPVSVGDGLIRATASGTPSIGAEITGRSLGIKLPYSGHTQGVAGVLAEAKLPLARSFIFTKTLPLASRGSLLVQCIASAYMIVPSDCTRGNGPEPGVLPGRLGMFA